MSKRGDKQYRDISAYIELTKPRIMTLVLVTTFLGFFLSTQSISSWPRLIWTLLGAALVCAGASALNHYLERDVDGLMERTKSRPLPTGQIPAANALVFGLCLVLVGTIALACLVNLLTAFLSLLTAFLYVLIYTPLKRISWLNTFIGAIPGAIPPMGGWTAAVNNIDLGAWVLFAILFIWQHPHFFAIAWMCREDYSRAGLKMLPAIDPQGKKTFLLIKIFSVLLIPVSILPTLIGLSGKFYLIGATVSGIVLAMIGASLILKPSTASARRMLAATVYYLPVLLMFILLDVSFNF